MPKSYQRTTFGVNQVLGRLRVVVQRNVHHLTMAFQKTKGVVFENLNILVETTTDGKF